VKRWLRDGYEVRIFTARVAEASAADGRDLRKTVLAIQNWCEFNIGARLTVTCVKDYGLIELWDDRAVGVGENTGESWRDVILDGLANCCCLRKEHEKRPLFALGELIDWHCAVSLDPAVSKEARELQAAAYQKGYDQARMDLQKS
jgi:hypothetical protein